MIEAEARKASTERGWTLEKQGKAFRLVDENGTVVAADWSNPRRVLRAQPGRRRRGARAVTVRLVDEAGIPLDVVTALAGQYGLTLEDWAEFSGVPDHVWWNIRRHHGDREARLEPDRRFWVREVASGRSLSP